MPPVTDLRCPFCNRLPRWDKGEYFCRQTTYCCAVGYFRTGGEWNESVKLWKELTEKAKVNKEKIKFLEAETERLHEKIEELENESSRI